MLLVNHSFCVNHSDFLFTDCPLEVEDLNKLAQMHDPNKEDAVDYSLFITCKKFISKVKALGKVLLKLINNSSS